MWATSRKIHTVWCVVAVLALLPVGCGDDSKRTEEQDSGDGDGADTSTGEAADTDKDDGREFGAENLRDQACPEYYEVVPMPVEQLGAQSAAVRAINERGWVVGAADTYDRELYESGVFVWIPEEDNSKVGALTVLNNGAADGSEFDVHAVTDVNDRGQLIGRGSYPDPDAQGFETIVNGYLWSREDGLVKIPGYEVLGLEISAINNDGVVVGAIKHSEGEDEYHTGFSWTVDVGFTLLPRVPGAYDWAGSELNDINEKGVMVGGVDDYHQQIHPVKYTAGTGFSKLPDYETTLLSRGLALGVNNLGQVVGSASKYYPAVGGTYSRPILWEANGEMHDLGILSANSSLYAGEAVDINDAGLVVGADFASGGGVPSYAWVWCGGVKRALDDVIDADPQDDWHFSWVAGINNEGQIAANGPLPGTAFAGRSALLVPVFGIIPVE